jgi:IS5 family transposase
MSSNKFAASCAECGEIVPPRAGTLEKKHRGRGRRWVVRHRECDPNPRRRRGTKPARGGERVRVVQFRTSGGTFYRNAAGVCEDAPCCGCCTG